MKVQLQEIQTQSGSTDTPVLEFCRKLLQNGINPTTPLEVYRLDVSAITVRTIGEGAKLTVQENTSGTPIFRKYLPPHRH